MFQNIANALNTMEIADPERRKALTASLVELLGNILTKQAGEASLSNEPSMQAAVRPLLPH